MSLQVQGRKASLRGFAAEYQVRYLEAVESLVVNWISPKVVGQFEPRSRTVNPAAFAASLKALASEASDGRSKLTSMLPHRNLIQSSPFGLLAVNCTLSPVAAWSMSAIQVTPLLRSFSFVH
jgi:hypothetical protein